MSNMPWVPDELMKMRIVDDEGKIYFELLNPPYVPRTGEKVTVKAETGTHQLPVIDIITMFLPVEGKLKMITQINVIVKNFNYMANAGFMLEG
jgi:hypothetical protein